MPQPRDLARRQAGDVVAGEAHRAAVGRVAAGQHVEAGRLAGAVRAHDPRQPAFLEREAHVLQHDLVAEALVQVRWLQTAPWATPSLAGATPAPAAARVRSAGARARLPDAGDALGLPQHHRHEQQPVPEQPGLGGRAEQVAREDEEQRRRSPGPRSSPGRRRSAPSSRRSPTSAGSSRSDRPTAAPSRTARRRARRPPTRCVKREPLVEPHVVADEGGAHLVLPDRREHAPERRMHAAATAGRARRPRRRRSRNRTAPRCCAGRRWRSRASAAGRLMLSRPSSPPVTLCHLIATNQNTWPKAMVSSA